MAAVDVSQSPIPSAGENAWQASLTPEVTLPSLSSVDQLMIDCLAGMRATPARDAAIYHLQTGGHRMRAKLALASSAGRMDVGDGRAAAAACELLHNASLIHDDISDHDQYRRGQHSVRALYGDDVALCAGDLLLTAAFQTAAGIHEPGVAQRLTGFMADTAARVIGGQSVELDGRSNRRGMGVADYLAATREKTAPLIELALNVGISNATEAPYPAALGRQLAEAIGLAYQILDDLDDLEAVEDLEHLHPLHAWWQHQPRPLVRQGHHRKTRQRCLTHVQAALARAQRLAGRLPEPLATDVLQLIHRLSRQSRIVSDRALTR